ncbi:MAG: hypothetical protein DRN30_05955, partial [Thermoplasmata archaeon]
LPALKGRVFPQELPLRTKVRGFQPTKDEVRDHSAYPLKTSRPLSSRLHWRAFGGMITLYIFVAFQ